MSSCGFCLWIGICLKRSKKMAMPKTKTFFFFFSQKKQLCDSCYTTVEEMCVHMHTCVHIYAHINTPTRPVTLCTQFPAKLGKEILVIFDDLVKGIAQGNLVPSRFMLSGYVPAAYPRLQYYVAFPAWCILITQRVFIQNTLPQRWAKWWYTLHSTKF